MNRLSKPQVIFYLIGIFLAGVVTGAVLTVVIGRRMMPNQEKMAAHWTHELQQKLSLTPAQVMKIEPIIGETMDGFRGTMANNVLASLSNCNARIALELTPEQMPKFIELEKEQQDFIRGRFGVSTNEGCVNTNAAAKP